MNGQPGATREFTIVRELEAPRELVFRAWTDPEHLTRWFGPRGCSTPRASIATDVRPGGTWRATMVLDETGQEFPTGGFYLEVREPERLVLTWREPGGDDESVVTVVLADLGEGRTAMTFHQAGFTTEETRRGVHEGWSSAFDRLCEHVTDPEGKSA
ncbi:SRPBCC domain-containing protein [Pseudonocardia sp. MH-G8]|uniref:SRPBCC family protein n=1 Tax=Pseudonocardia sp. MH-G8 TaxID=1854588 RepID=UPI000BA09EDE|nr:SRPBCC domain-containing protein [Pseudonocardia sp. MH-G8]OZM76016.1 polyketide cyclase [Pseudonocardia sp. MH-G8]